MLEEYIKFSLELENRELVRNIVKIIYIYRAMRLEGWKGRMRAEKRARNAFTSIIRVEFEDKRKRANRANRPGPIITVISMKTSLSGLTGSYRGEGGGERKNNRAGKDSIFEIMGG